MAEVSESMVLRVEQQQRAKENSERRGVAAEIMVPGTVPGTVLAVMSPTRGAMAPEVAPIGRRVASLDLDLMAAAMSPPAGGVRGAGEGRRREQSGDGDGDT